MGYPKATATRSEFSFAIIFGVISPKMRTITVETATETAPLSDGLGIAFSKMLLNRTERVMFTMLLPTRIVERSLSKFSDSASAFLAALLPSCALSLSFVRFRELNAVSVAEKNPENATNIIMKIIEARRLSGSGSGLGCIWILSFRYAAYAAE